jgi:hypothetical protein
MSLYELRVLPPRVNAIQLTKDDQARFLGWLDACDIRLSITSDLDGFKLRLPYGASLDIGWDEWLVRFGTPEDYAYTVIAPLDFVGRYRSIDG